MLGRQRAGTHGNEGKTNIKQHFTHGDCLALWQPFDSSFTSKGTCTGKLWYAPSAHRAHPVSLQRKRFLCVQSGCLSQLNILSVLRIFVFNVPSNGTRHQVLVACNVGVSERDVKLEWFLSTELVPEPLELLLLSQLVNWKLHPFIFQDSGCSRLLSLSHKPWKVASLRKCS